MLDHGGRTVRCARAVPHCVKIRLFSTTGSHGSQGPEFCILPPPCWYSRVFLV